MQLKIKILKCTKMLRKIYIIAIGTLFIAHFVSAQEKLKIDGVATVVGKNIVLDSEVEAFKNELLPAFYTRYLIDVIKNTMRRNNPYKRLSHDKIAYFLSK